MKISNVPTIDFQSAKTNPSQLKLLDSACRDHGFFFIINHGMQKEINEMWKESKRFFELSREEKLKIITLAYTQLKSTYRGKN